MSVSKLGNPNSFLPRTLSTNVVSLPCMRSTHTDYRMCSGLQWPGTAGQSPRNFWEYELVLLQGDANNRKKDVSFSHSL